MSAKPGDDQELTADRTGDALARYDQAGQLHGHERHDQAKAALVERWGEQRRATPDQSSVILT